MTTLLPGFTNMVHRVELDGVPVVIRQGRPIAKLLGIDRDREIAVLRQIRGLEIGPELLRFDAARDRTTFRAIPGVALDHCTPDRALLARTLHQLARLHRQPLDGRTLLGQPFSAASMIRRYLEMRAVPLELERTCVHQALLAEDLEREASLCLCHNDCVSKNWILLPDGSVRMIDFEFAARHDPAFDLATWCRSFGIGLEDSLLAEYEQWNPRLAGRVRVYIPVVDTLWVLFRGILATEDARGR